VSEENRRQIDLAEIEKRLLSISDFQKEVAVIRKEDQLFAIIYPNFDLLKKANIINIEEELKWYAVELYNIEAEQDKKIAGYKIVTQPLPRTASGEWDRSAILAYLANQKKTGSTEREPDDETYRELKNYLSSVSTHPIFPSSHLELDLGLDSLEYVKLFIFIEKSYGIHLDEKEFSKLMIMQDLYLWILRHKKRSDTAQVDWGDILREESGEKLVYSPWIMMAWKIVLLPFFKLYFRLKVSGIENLPREPFIIAPTHYSMLDGFIVLATLPFPVLKKSFFLAYEGEFGTPWLKPVAIHSQILLIDTNKNLKRSLQRTALPLLESQNLVIFPEGARSRNGKLLKFKKFFAILSRETNVPIVPVVLHGTFEAMPAGRVLPKRTKISIKYLKPVYPDDKRYDELSDQVKNSILAEL
jgi:long-chain acyl-CoA synthetase